MLMKNRSWSSPTAVLLATTSVVLTVIVLCSSSDAFPAQRRTFSLVDRLIRANPIRQLANYLGRKLSMELYYPPPPPHHVIHPNSQIFYLPAAPIPTHYTKVPAMPPVYYTPALTMPPPQPQPHQQFVLHGVSYHVPLLPQQQLQPLVQVHPALSSYHPVVAESTNSQHSPSVPITSVPQPGILVDEQSQVHSSVQQPSANYHVESTHPSDNSLMNLPTIVSSADVINESPSGLLSLPNLPELSENMQMHINGYEDASSSEDMLKIFVIRPKDIEKMKSSSKLERAELVKEYFDVEHGTNLALNSASGELTNDNRLNKDNCIEPLCDPFLRKLIPELFSSTNFNGNGDPIVIVKNNSDTGLHPGVVDQFLSNHRLDFDVESEHSQPNEGAQVTIMRAIEEDNGSTDEILQGQHSSLEPQRVRVHFPRKTLLSAKVNSTTITKYEPTVGGSVMSSEAHENKIYNKFRPLQKSRVHKSSSSTSQDHFNCTTSSIVSRAPLSDSPFHSLVPKPRNFKPERTYPYYRYGSKEMAKQRTVRGSDNINDKFNHHHNSTNVRKGKSSKSAHYTAGVIFNNSKVSKSTLSDN